MFKIVLFSILLFLIILLIFSNIRKVRDANLFSSVSLSFSFYYLIIPLIIYILDYNQQLGLDRNTGGIDRIVYFIIVAIVYLVLFLSYNGFSKKKYKYFVVNYEKFEISIKKIGFFSLLVGGISLLFLFISLGGIISALAVAEQARSFNSNNVETLGTVARLIVSAKFVILSPYCFLFLFLQNRSKIYKYLLICSFLLSLLFYLFDASRSSLMIFLVPFFIPFIKKFISHPWLFIIIGGVLCINLLNVLDAMFVYFETGEYSAAEFDWLRILPQFSFPYRTFVNIFNILENENIRWGYDFITTWLNYIPGITFEQSYEPISRFWSGVDWRKYGGTPTDFISFSILEFHLIGIFVVPYFFGRLLRKIDNIMICLKQQSKGLDSFVIILRSYLMLLLFFYIPSFDFCAIVAGYSIIIFFYIILKKTY